MKKLLFFLLIPAVFCLVGCVPKTTPPQGENIDNLNSIVNSAQGQCAPGPVDLANYGDKGQRLANCFVEYPGEPTRQDKSYYIIEDICGQFTQEFVENLLGQKIIKIEPSSISSVYSCRYYFNDQNYIWLNLEYLNADNQKKGQEALGRTIKTDPRIAMENFVVWQTDGLINEIYLVLSDNKFISLNRSSSQVLDNDKILDFAVHLAQAIKNYK